MTAALSSSKIHQLAYSETTDGPSAVVVYYVNVTEPTTPANVFNLATGATGSDDAVPQYGDPYDTGIDSQPINQSLLASRFEVEQRESGPTSRLKWAVTVTYEPQETAGQRGLQMHISPLQRDVRWWTEQLVVQEPIEFAENKTTIRWGFLETDQNKPGKGAPVQRKAGTFGPITNAAGMITGQAGSRQIRYPVFVFKSYTLDPFKWVDVERSFAKTVNNGDWEVFGSAAVARKGECRYLGVETSRPLFWGTILYYELETRVLWDPEGHDILVPNWGTEYWQKFRDPERNPNLPPEIATPLWGLTGSFPNGVPARNPVMLDRRGELRRDQRGDVDFLRFSDLVERDYDSLTYRLKNLG